MLKIITTKRYIDLIKTEQEYNVIKPADRQHIKNMELRIHRLKKIINQKDKKIIRQAEILNHIKIK